MGDDLSKYSQDPWESLWINFTSKHKRNRSKQVTEGQATFGMHQKQKTKAKC